MADPLISALVVRLVSIVEQRLTEEINLVSGVGKEVEKLSILLKGIQAVLNDAENRRVEETVKFWLEQFEEHFYDIDDVLDKWNTAILKNQISRDEANSSTPPTKGKVLFLLSSPLSYFKKIRTRRGIALEIKTLNERLESIDGSRRKLDLLPSVSDGDYKRFKPLESVALIDKSEIFGRHSDQESLVNKLLFDDISNVKHLDVISIVGTGGLGKTTLAQLAFNDDRVKNKFDHTIWVCVSDPFSESQVAKIILESLVDDFPNSPSLNYHLSQIREILTNKRILLVLDDVWPHDRKKWDQVRLCLQNVTPRSKVLVTTRDKRVAVSMGTHYFHSINTLSEEDCWCLVKNIAFGNKNINHVDSEKFEIIGRKLANKCRGLPLAAKTVGSVLALKDSIPEWNAILVSKLWELENVKVELFPHLFLSYTHLPLGLRHCFKICSIFPKDYKIQTKKLIQIWISLGYLVSYKDNENMEEKGYEYIDNLVMCSFFQDVERSHVDGKIEFFRIHDIVHDFVQYLTEKECLMIESGNGNQYRRGAWRHLKVVDSDIVDPLESTIFSYINGMEKIRTLFVEAVDISKVGGLPNLLKHLKYMRCLNLTRCNLRKVPDEITLLIHLRYIDLSYNYLSELPEEICHLCNLESMNLTWCQFLTKLPQAIGKLISLRHLVLKNTNNLKQLPKGILKLTRLRTLNKFIVGDGTFKLEDLKYFNHLEGEVCIDDYGNEEEAVNVDEVDAIVNKYKRMFCYYMGDGEGGIHKLAMKSLKFPYGTDFGPLMSTFRNMRHLYIQFCMVHTLPPLWKLQFLEMLQIVSEFGLQYLGVEFLGIGKESVNCEKSPIIAFPKLKALEFNGCFNLTKWDNLSYRQMNSNDLVMPSLVDLKVKSCEILEDLPHGVLNMVTQLRNVHITGSTKLVGQYRKGKWDKHIWISRVTLNADKWDWEN